MLRIKRKKPKPANGAMPSEGEPEAPQNGSGQPLPEDMDVPVEVEP